MLIPLLEKAPKIFHNNIFHIKMKDTFAYFINNISKTALNVKSTDFSKTFMKFLFCLFF